MPSGSSFLEAREKMILQPCLDIARRTLARSFPDDDLDDGVSTASLSLVILEELVAWMRRQGWAPEGVSPLRIERTVECCNLIGVRKTDGGHEDTGRRMALSPYSKLRDMLPGYVSGGVDDDDSEAAQAFDALTDVLQAMGSVLHWRQELRGEGVDQYTLPSPPLNEAAQSLRVASHIKPRFGDRS